MHLPRNFVMIRYSNSACWKTELVLQAEIARIQDVTGNQLVMVGAQETLDARCSSLFDADMQYRLHLYFNRPSGSILDETVGQTGRLGKL